MLFFHNSVYAIIFVSNGYNSQIEIVNHVTKRTARLRTSHGDHYDSIFVFFLSSNIGLFRCFNINNTKKGSFLYHFFYNQNKKLLIGSSLFNQYNIFRTFHK